MSNPSVNHSYTGASRSEAAWHLSWGLPQAGQAGSGTEFEGFGLLLTGDVEGLVETGCRLRRIRHRLLASSKAPLSRYSSASVVTHSVGVHRGQRLSQRAPTPRRGVRLPHTPPPASPGNTAGTALTPWPAGGKSLTESPPGPPRPGPARPGPSRAGPYPGATHSTNPCAVARVVPAAACAVRRRTLAAALMHDGRMDQRLRQANGVRHLRRQGACRLSVLQGLIRIAQVPQRPGAR